MISTIFFTTADFESDAVTVSPHPRVRNSSTPHPTDPAIGLNQWRRSLGGHIMAVLIALLDGNVEILGTRQGDLMKAVFA